MTAAGFRLDSPSDSYRASQVAALQENGRLPIADLAEKIGLSTTPCWRRVRRLEENGGHSGLHRDH
ncbi:MAG: hypothetical protein CL388_06315 [Acidiferrobacteraceae bacterium]|nr:hypothetical protein [Acidiferrobacteraceae bacterium]